MKGHWTRKWMNIYGMKEWKNRETVDRSMEEIRHERT